MISGVDRFDDAEIDVAVWNGMLDYCRLDDGGTFWNQDPAAKTASVPDVWLVPVAGAAIGNAIYFGSDNPFKMIQVIAAAANADNT